MKPTLIALCLIGSSVHAVETKRIVIGLASNFSSVSVNSYNPFGKSFKNGAFMAIDEAKDRLKARGVEIDLKEFDYGSNLLQVRNAVERAVESPAVAVVGYEFSDDALMAAPLHQKAGLLMLTPSASADRLATFGGFVRQTTFTNAFQGKTLARFAREKLNAKTAVVIAAVDCSYCVDLARGFTEAFTAQGGAIRETKEILSNIKDPDVVLSELNLMGVDIIVVPNHELTSARVIRSLLKRGVRKPFLGGDGWRTLGSKFRFGASGEQFDGYMIAHWHQSVGTKASKDFIARYEKKFGAVPTDSAVLTYDTMRLLVQAIEKLGPATDRATIEKAVADIRVFDGVVGKYLFPVGATAPDKTAFMLKSYPQHFVVEAILEPEPSAKKKRVAE